MGDRWLDTRLGRTPKTDARAFLYPNISPYAYVGNNPINAIDPDGRLIIFVNGYYNSIANKVNMAPSDGGEKYWSYFSNGFVGRAKKFFKDNNVQFVDASSMIGFDKSGVDRYIEGYEYAKANYETLIATMGEGETLKLIAHSEGSANAAGIAAYFEEKRLTNKNAPVVEIVLQLSPDEADEFPSPKGPNTVRVTDELDPIAPATTPLDNLDLNITLGHKDDKRSTLDQVSGAHGKTISTKTFDLIEKYMNFFNNNPDVKSRTDMKTGNKAVRDYNEKEDGYMQGSNY